MPIEKQNVKYYSDFDKCLDDCRYFLVVFACDVLHHLPEMKCEQFIKKINKNYNHKRHRRKSCLLKFYKQNA
jgi:hypothetical protein